MKKKKNLLSTVGKDAEATLATSETATTNHACSGDPKKNKNQEIIGRPTQALNSN
jgi:hypothetical protein